MLPMAAQRSMQAASGAEYRAVRNPVGKAGGGYLSEGLLADREVRSAMNEYSAVRSLPWPVRISPAASLSAPVPKAADRRGSPTYAAPQGRSEITVCPLSS